MGPLDQGGLRRFLGRGSEAFEAGPLIPNLIAGYYPASQQV